MPGSIAGFAKPINKEFLKPPPSNIIYSKVAMNSMKGDFLSDPFGWFKRNFPSFVRCAKPSWSFKFCGGYHLDENLLQCFIISLF